ncbi:integral inner membrane protein [Bacillus freudenreichii]|nr:integral inner membrane protein [Bacillus freudenreichii]
MNLLTPHLIDRRFLWMLLMINIAGTVYGYYWYIPQLAVTPSLFLLFVPDSPTASLFFVFVVIAFLRYRNYPLFEALALITLIKYGVWAVVMNILTFKVIGYLPWQGYMLIASHGAMAIQGILYAKYYKFKLWHVLAVAIWTLHNDVIDYVFMQYPKYPGLEMYEREIGYFTFWLSIVSIGIALYVYQTRKREDK